VTTRVDFPVIYFSTCRQCLHPIRKDNVPWNNAWQREGGDKRCVTMVGCIPERP
jgi:hypothetical protein